MRVPKAVCCTILSLALCSCGVSPTNLTPASPPASLNSIQHIIFLVQENRSFDSYFGALRQYWAQNNIPDESLDGLPQFNPASGPLTPLQGPLPSNPGCNPADPYPSDCVIEGDPLAAVHSYHFKTVCVENPDPSWNEAHYDWDYNDPVGTTPAKLNGFVWTAAHDARVDGFYDQNGARAMGYYDGNDLNYYYFMASHFATSDRWFQPLLSRTQINRAYLFAATSQGRVYPNGTDAQDSTPITAKTIFQDMQDHGITWKIYENPERSNCTGPPYEASCLMQLSEFNEFSFAQTIVSTYPQNIVPISQYFTDLKNGTLPDVAYIDPAIDAGLDEHPSISDSAPDNIQAGAQYVSTLINGLMSSSSWQDSVFILTWDESGGFYDHVSPQPAVSPDGIKPIDLEPTDVCTQGTGPLCDFTWTGYRIPLIVISPYTKQHYVSHTVADYTAILKFIETRFNLPALTKRDAAQMDMTEFFDFQNPPYMTPPMPPAQNTNGACYLNKLP